MQGKEVCLPRARSPSASLAAVMSANPSLCPVWGARALRCGRAPGSWGQPPCRLNTLRTWLNSLRGRPVLLVAGHLSMQMFSAIGGSRFQTETSRRTMDRETGTKERPRLHPQAGKRAEV
jgi:hypothetical protein